jgi:hypothetical protein
MRIIWLTAKMTNRPKRENLCSQKTALIEYDWMAQTAGYSGQSALVISPYRLATVRELMIQQRN